MGRPLLMTMRGTFIYLCYIWTVTRVPGSDGAKGREFLVMFPNSPGSVYSLTVTLAGSRTDVLANVKVTIPRDLQRLNTAIVLGGDHSLSRQIFMDTDVALTTSGKHSTSAICVMADNDVVVHAMASFVRAMGLGKSMYALVVLPISQLSSYYTTMTSCYENHCFIAIGSLRDDTDVFVAVRTQQLVDGQGFVLYGGDVQDYATNILETLSAYEVMYIRSFELDLSGTRIYSSGPIAVISGGEFDHIGGGTRKDAIAEQIPPVASLGNVFVLASFPMTDFYTVVFVVFPHASPRLDYDASRLLEITQTKNKKIFALLAAPTVLVSTENILVTLLLPSGQSYGIGHDPGLTLAMPFHLWSSRYSLACDLNGISNKKRMELYLVIYTCQGCDAFRFLNDTVPWRPGELEWTASDTFQAAHLRLPDSVTGRLSVWSDRCTFGGFVTGVGQALGWAYAFGWDFVPTSQYTKSTDVSTQDNLCARLQESSDIVTSYQTQSTSEDSVPSNSHYHTVTATILDGKSQTMHSRNDYSQQSDSSTNHNDVILPSNASYMTSYPGDTVPVFPSPSMNTPCTTCARFDSTQLKHWTERSPYSKPQSSDPNSMSTQEQRLPETFSSTFDFVAPRPDKETASIFILPSSDGYFKDLPTPSHDTVTFAQTDDYYGMHSNRLSWGESLPHTSTFSNLTLFPSMRSMSTLSSDEGYSEPSNTDSNKHLHVSRLTASRPSIESVSATTFGNYRQFTNYSPDLNSLTTTTASHPDVEFRSHYSNTPQSSGLNSPLVFSPTPIQPSINFNEYSPCDTTPFLYTSSSLFTTNVQNIDSSIHSQTENTLWPVSKVSYEDKMSAVEEVPKIITSTSFLNERSKLASHELYQATPSPYLDIRENSELFTSSLQDTVESHSHTTPSSVSITQNSQLVQSSASLQVITPFTTTAKSDVETGVLKLCPCSCKNSTVRRVANISKAGVQQMLREEIQEELFVGKTTLSKAVRRKTSAGNKQASSQYLGSFVAISVCAVVAGVIVGPDVVILARYLHKIQRPIVVKM